MSIGFTTSANVANIFGSLGGIVSGIGNIVQAKQEKKAGEYNASIYEEQAQATRTSQALLESQKRRLIKSRIGEQTAIFAKSGLRMSGSSLGVQLDSLANAEMDIAIDRYNADIEARGLTSKAARERVEAKQSSTLSYLRAGKSFLSTAADLYTSQREIGRGKNNGKGS